MVYGDNRMITKTNMPPEWSELLEASDALMKLLNDQVYLIDVNDIDSKPMSQEEGAFIAGILTRLDNAIEALKPNRCNAAAITTT